jgi:hypothetical protein
MRPDKKRLKEQLIKTYEEKLDKLFEELDPQAELHLNEIEAAALALRKEVGKEITQVLVNEQSRTKTPDMICPNCVERMQNKGKKAKQISTRSGEVDMERPHYYCANCGTGFFPPG